MMLLVFPFGDNSRNPGRVCIRLPYRHKNHQTDLPVGFAAVLLTCESDGRILSGSCDDQGICRFERVAAGRYKLRVTFLGYKPYTQVIPVDDSFTWLALLEPDAVNLDEVVVTASESRGMTQLVQDRPSGHGAPAAVELCRSGIVAAGRTFDGSQYGCCQPDPPEGGGIWNPDGWKQYRL